MLTRADSPVSSGDFGDRYFGTDGTDGRSEEDQEEPSRRHKSRQQKAEDTAVKIPGL